MNEELKPCPFCGGDVRNVYPVNPTLFDNHFLVICQQCGCIGPFSDEWKNGSLSPREFQEKAVTAWNTRVERMVNVGMIAVADTNVAPERGHQPIFECSNCGWDDLCCDIRDDELNYCPNCGAKIIKEKPNE